MMVKLRRATFSPDSPTYGVLLNWNIPLCLTLEKPWLDNQHDISCIPQGIYRVVKHDSLKHPNTWEITGVPNRTGILIHPANQISELKGCIAPGRSFLNGGVQFSQAAMSDLIAKLPLNFELEITNP